MAQGDIAAELLTMRLRAEGTAENIKQTRQNLSSERRELGRLVKEYSAKRVELIVEDLHTRGLTWCTCCAEESRRTPKVLPEKEAELLLLEGKEEYSHGYGNAYYGFRDFFQLHRACPKCREAAYDKHGTRGRYDTQAKDQSSCFAFRVEKREDGYYARKFGRWIKLEQEKCLLPAPPSELIEHLAATWNMPARIELKSEWPHSEETLVIHEQTAMAEAV